MMMVVVAVTAVVAVVGLRTGSLFYTPRVSYIAAAVAAVAVAAVAAAAAATTGLAAPPPFTRAGLSSLVSLISCGSFRTTQSVRCYTTCSIRCVFFRQIHPASLLRLCRWFSARSFLYVTFHGLLENTFICVAPVDPVSSLLRLTRAAEKRRSEERSLNSLRV